MSRQNKTREREQARKILANHAFYWNLGTQAGIRGSLRRAHWVRDAAAMAPGKTILEVGCGTGFYSGIFADSGARLYSIDLSPEFIYKAVERVGSRAAFQVCDIENLPCHDNTFNAVVGVRVLHHLDMKRSFREIIRVLKPAGVIAFCEPNMLNPQLLIQKNVPWIKRWMGDTPDETAFFKQRLRAFLRKQGFTNIRIEPFDFLHPWTPVPLMEFVEKTGRIFEQIPVIREIAGSLQIRAEIKK